MHAVYEVTDLSEEQESRRAVSGEGGQLRTNQCVSWVERGKKGGLAVAATVLQQVSLRDQTAQ